MPLFPLNNYFSFFALTLLAGWCPFISSTASLCGLHPSCLHFTSLPPQTLCHSSADPGSTSSVQEPGASTFVQSTQACLGAGNFDEMLLLEQNVYATFLEFPFIQSLSNYLIPAVAKYLMI